MAKLKVLFIEHCDYISYPIGGQHSFIRELLANVTVDVYLAGIATNGEPLLEWTNKEVAGRLRPFIALEKVDRDGKKSTAPGRLQQLLRLILVKKRLLECKPDVVFTQSPEAIFPFLTGKKQIPSVFGLAGANNPLSHSRFKWARWILFQKIYEKILLKTAISRASSVMAINDDCVKLCNRLRGDRKPNWSKIPVAVNMKIFRVLDRKLSRREIGFTEECPFILCVGRLAKVKGYELAFDVLQLMLNNHDVRLLLVGEGEEREVLEYETRHRGISDKVIFCGSISHDKLPWYLNAANIFFMPSLAEGLPVAMLEAMSCGLPVVASAVGGIPEVIKNGENGFLIYDRNPTVVAEVVEHALQISDEFRNRITDTVEKNFSITVIAKKIEKLFIAAGDKGSLKN